MIVILCDGSSKGNPGPASIGIVAWDRTKNSKIVCPNYRYSASIGIKTSIQAEWLALIESMKLAKMYNERLDKYIFSDSKIVINQAKGYWNVKHENTKSLYQEFLKLKKQISKLQIDWVPRQLINLADKAAKEGGK